MFLLLGISLALFCKYLSPSLFSALLSSGKRRAHLGMYAFTKNTFTTERNLLVNITKS